MVLPDAGVVTYSISTPVGGAGTGRASDIPGGRLTVEVIVDPDTVGGIAPTTEREGSDPHVASVVWRRRANLPGEGGVRNLRLVDHSLVSLPDTHCFDIREGELCGLRRVPEEADVV